MYYVIGAVLRLCHNASFLSSGWVPCKDLLASARTHELANFSKWVASISAANDSELQGKVANVTGGSILAFRDRVSGVTKGEDLNGDQLDFAFGTLYQDVRIMVIHADRIFATSTEKELLACEPNFFPGEAAKRQVAFAVLSGLHFSIGAAHSPGMSCPV